MLKLIEEFGARGNIYVATEKARGALLYTLMQYPQLTLFPLNSKATGKLREALRAGGAKNDRRDCRLQAELVKHFHHLLPVWRPDDVLTRKLAALCDYFRWQHMWPSIAETFCMKRLIPVPLLLAETYVLIFAKRDEVLSGLTALATRVISASLAPVTSRSSSESLRVFCLVAVAVQEYK